MEELPNEPGFGGSGIPLAVLAFIESVNGGDLDALAACFSETAVILDGSREFIGTSEIKAWASRKVIHCRYRVLDSWPLPNGIRVLVISEAPAKKVFFVWYTFRVREYRIIFADMQLVHG
ncbi:nuclear transport factor 2 family protein [Paenibacillus sp. P26]|nr:nuclear transport factor 2 family protein [Paenibacillus sp. P26]UUZ95123.1 nuclear transport factor 2 family protein [Paenibacillus sp. P25]